MILKSSGPDEEGLCQDLRHMLIFVWALVGNRSTDNSWAMFLVNCATGKKLINSLNSNAKQL